MPRGIPNKPKTKKAPAKKTARKTTAPKTFKRKYARKPKAAVDIAIPAPDKRDFEGLIQKDDPRADAAALGRELHQAVEQAIGLPWAPRASIDDQMSFTQNDPATKREDAISASRAQVRYAVIAMCDATKAANLNTDAGNARVLKLQADLAGAQFDRAFAEFEKLIRG